MNSVMVVDVYTLRKQVGVKQLYNQVPQMAWVSLFEKSVSQFESVPGAVGVSWGTRSQRESQL